jgi:hypothetical protein
VPAFQSASNPNLAVFVDEDKIAQLLPYPNITKRLVISHFMTDKLRNHIEKIVPLAEEEFAFCA